MEATATTSGDCFTRPLSIPDLVYASSGSRRHHPQQVINQCVVEGQGILGRSELLSAIEKVAVATPACRMLLRGRWGFKQWRADGPLPALNIIEYPWDGHSCDDLPFLDGPLDLFAGPVMEITQVISSKTYLVFRVHHAVMDGVATNEFIQNFFRALRNESLEPIRSATTDDYFRRKKNCSKEKPKLEPALSPVRENAVQGSVERIVSGRFWKRITLDGSSLLAMPNTMLALARIARRSGSGVVRFQVPVDLRRHQPGLKASGNLIGIMSLYVDEQDTVRSLVKKINRQLASSSELTTAEPKWIVFLAKWTPFSVLERWARYVMSHQLQMHRYFSSATLSSISAGSLEDYSTEDFTAASLFGVPIEPLTAPIFVAICGNAKTTEITVCANQQRVNRDALESMCDELKQELAHHI